MQKMPSKTEDLTLPQLMAIELLLAKDLKGLKFSEIAQACEVSERTLQRWRQLPAFQAEYRRRAVQLLGDSLPQVLQVLQKKAIQGSNKSIELYLKTLGLMKSEIDVTARPGPPKDDRSNEAIDAEIRQLEQELELIEREQKDEKEENK